jgi:hypothetical protein
MSLAVRRVSGGMSRAMRGGSMTAPARRERLRGIARTRQMFAAAIKEIPNG